MGPTTLVSIHLRPTQKQGRIYSDLGCSIIDALPPRRQQLYRSQFLFRLLEPFNTLSAFVLFHMFGKAEDIGVQELFARHQIQRTLVDDADFFRQFPFWFLLAAHDADL